MYNSGIYIITNNINNKYYIGSSCNLKKRFSEHKRKLLQNKHENDILQKAINKYGLDYFSFNILMYCNKNDLLFYEQRFLTLYKPEYNICITAGNNLGYKHSEETKNKIRTAVLGRKHTETSKQKMKQQQKLNPTNGMLGKTHSEETKNKIGLKHKGKFVSEETRQKMRNAHLGKKLSEEHRIAVNEAKNKRYANRKISS